jgi:hypothetical protein
MAMTPEKPSKLPELGSAELPLDGRIIFDLRVCQNMTAAVYVPVETWREWFGSDETERRE